MIKKIQARTYKVRPFRPVFVLAMILVIIALSNVFMVSLAPSLRLKIIEVFLKIAETLVSALG
jgi:hypothetical protein